MGSNTANLQNSYKNLRKEIKTDNFCYRKVGKANTKWGAIEKSPILRYQLQILKGNKIISYFDGSNNSFADCKYQTWCSTQLK